uniref:Uncharacterized protein n=1 Tax=Lactuca sativa TaxID=4236 RepID=A0A9R1X7K3_LACSA|nr:hypothetical protein LSAT_V11C500253880 [Lactuca sativa]
MSVILTKPVLHPLYKFKNLILLRSSKTPYIQNPNVQKIQILEDSQISKLNQGFHVLIVFSSVVKKLSTSILTKLENITKLFFKTLVVKAQILKDISLEDWAFNPHFEKSLVGYAFYPSFSYYDYQEAWFKAFLICSYSHSLFMFFDLNFDCGYPRWFVNWFKLIGLIPSCLPKEIMKRFLKFKELYVQPILEF